MVAPRPFDLSRQPAAAHRRTGGDRRRGTTGGPKLGLSVHLVALPAVLSLLLSLLAPVAVAQDDDEDAAAGEPPTGDYTVAITEDDIPSDLVNGPDLIGRWQIFLRPDGTFSLRRADVGEVATGSYTVDGETIAITDEAGLLSCVNAVPTGGAGVTDTATGTYAWEQEEDGGLTLSAIEEGCAGRELILATRPLDVFVACETEPIAITPPTGDAGDEEASDDTSPTDEDEATEDDEAAAEGEQAVGDEAEPEDDDALDDPFGGDEEEEDGGLDNPFGGDDDEENAEVDEDSAADGIDAVLGQLTACWTTQDPARVLPLFGSVFLDALTEQAGSLYDVAGIFGQIMAIPITWERAGEIDLAGTDATALVSQTIGAEESFVRFQFVFEDGVWKLASFG